MHRLNRVLFAAVASLALLTVAFAATGGPAPPMRFGMDPGAIGFLAEEGVKPDYAAFWAGPWNERAGWSYLGAIADRAADRGVQPVVHWYYWGDEIGVSCVTDGCRGDGVWKSRANWAADARKLADALHAGLQGRSGVLILESEFNKNGIATWEAFDGYLVEQARIFRDRAPELQLVMGFGNWHPEHWARFDRAVAASDLVGFQTMRASTRDSLGEYRDAVDTIKTATARLHGAFGKPVLLYDLALSSYPEPGWAGHQESEVKELFARLGELRSAGLSGIIYRGLDDEPDFTLSEYYKVAERHMGLRYHWGGWKPALDDWVRGVKAARAGSGVAAEPTSIVTPAGGGDATFRVRSLGNTWWVEVEVSDWPTERVVAIVDGGPGVALARTSWGTWARSFHVPDGARVVFRATGSAGADDSAAYVWGGPAALATFTPRSQGNDWWVEVRVASEGIAEVAARVDSGSWTTLPRTSWGSYAKSLRAPDGSTVQFRAATAGGLATSAAYPWP